MLPHHVPWVKAGYFHYTFYLIFRLVSVYTVYTEKEQSEGRVDCIVETPDYVYIFEFKLDGSANEALKQIEEKNYNAELIKRGVKEENIHHYGFAFRGKEVLIDGR